MCVLAYKYLTCVSVCVDIIGTCLCMCVSWQVFCDLMWHNITATAEGSSFVKSMQFNLQFLVELQMAIWPKHINLNIKSKLFLKLERSTCFSTKHHLFIAL